MGEIVKNQFELIQTIVNSIGDAVVACDLKGKFIFYNSAATEILGPDVSEDSPENWTSNFGSFLTDKVTPFPMDQYPLLRGLKGEETNEVEQFIRNKSKPEGAFISISGRPLRDEHSNILGSVVVVRDISSRKKMEEEIRKTSATLLEKNLELAASNKELESFSYAVSHDLRTPLRAIIGFSDVLLKKFSDKLNAEALDYLNRIKDSGDKLGQLIDGLLDLSRLAREALKREEISLSEIAKNVAADLVVQAPDRRVRFEIAENIFANADQRLIHSVILNLMGNAWKFTSKKEEARIEFGVTAAQGHKTAYFIRDNGAGFNEKYSNKLFSIFQRLHAVKDFDGNGIGLATVQRIISRHGGKVWAEGKPNEGAVFYFTL